MYVNLLVLPNVSLKRRWFSK